MDNSSMFNWDNTMPLLVMNPKYKTEEDAQGIKTLFYLPGNFMVYW